MSIQNFGDDSQLDSRNDNVLSKFEIERLQMRNGHLERMAFSIVDEILNETLIFMDGKHQHIDFEDIKLATLTIARVLDSLGVKTPADE